MTAPQPPTIGNERIDYAEVLDQRTKMLILFGVLLGLFLSALDQTIVATALPRVAKELNGLSLYSWVTTIYLLTNTVTVPIYGKLSDIYGRKPVLLFGIVVFLIGSALCGMAGEPFLGNFAGGGMMQLVVFRGVQGLGAGALGSVAFAIIADLFAPAERARYQGLFGAVFGLSSVIGPLLGGFLTDNVSWRWVFYVNLPLGLIAVFFILSKMPRLASGLKPKVDYLGAALIVLASVPLLLALTWGADRTYAWTSPLILSMFGLTIVALIAFLFVESRHESPILPLSLFSNKTFLWSSIARFMIGAAFLGAILFLSLYLVQVQGVSATAAGTATIPLTIGLIIGAVGSGQIASRLGVYKPLMLIGLSVAALAFLWLSTLGPDTPYWQVVARMVVLGLGLGPALPLYTLAMQSAVQPTQIGVATSSGQFFQQIGSTIGTAIFGAILTSTLSAQLSTNIGKVAQDAPPSLRSQIERFQNTSGASSGASRAGASFDADAIRVQAEQGIKQGFAQQRDLITRALRDKDPRAIAALQGDAQTPPQLRGLLGNIDNVPPAATQQALQGTLQGLSQAETQAVTQADTTIGQLARAFKVSFSNSISRIYLISVLIAALALLATLMLPNLRLPKRGQGTAASRPAHVEV
ncbi:MDR family MFS transporter [Deinococcus yavapaiensis]|uniref:EmrB/QacA subfamily drug resistance transporter n=1 Tax=Deinococcus yavapaiensis KR-236 TaxID=694435 RepID=A0A318SC61_9DEIO|nr:MDR family MFS transporter [Deinococcus yavapaiensis]PYE56421.1 EmrB/QacA subfamily drug resistance transporter [Deinococcus yavapaiensis KR-236]